MSSNDCSTLSSCWGLMLRLLGTMLWSSFILIHAALSVRYVLVSLDVFRHVHSIHF